MSRSSRRLLRGRALSWSGAASSLAGHLTIKGVTGPVELDVAYLGAAADPWGGARAMFFASGSVNREDRGISWNMPLAGGGLLVSKEIQLELETIRRH